MSWIKLSGGWMNELKGVYLGGKGLMLITSYYNIKDIFSTLQENLKRRHTYIDQSQEV